MAGGTRRTDLSAKLLEAVDAAAAARTVTRPDTAYDRVVFGSTTTPGTSRTPTTEGGRIGSETGFGRRAIASQERQPFDLERAEVLEPAPTEGGGRPRVLRAAYDAVAQTIHVQFRDGTEWEYYDASPTTWGRYKRHKSSNRFIDRVANGLPYSEAPRYVWGDPNA